jgi:hypothetical protein
MGIDITIGTNPLPAGAQEKLGEFCDYLYSERDGWEWMKNSTETIVVVDEEGTVRRYSFELEYEPSFYVTELKEG